MNEVLLILIVTDIDEFYIDDIEIMLDYVQ